MVRWVANGGGLDGDGVEGGDRASLGIVEGIVEPRFNLGTIEGVVELRFNLGTRGGIADGMEFEDNPGGGLVRGGLPMYQPLLLRDVNVWLVQEFIRNIHVVVNGVDIVKVFQPVDQCEVGLGRF